MAESLELGLVLMATGMGTVVVLLALLVGLVGVVARFCRWLEPASPALVAAARPAPRAASREPDDELASVIGAAVKAYRNRHSR